MIWFSKNENLLKVHFILRTHYQLGNIPVWQHHDIIDWRYKVVHWTEQILSLESVHCPLLPQSVLSLPRGRAKQHQVSSVKRRPAITGSKSFLLRNPGQDLKWINDTGENVNIINEKLSFTRFEMIRKSSQYLLIFLPAENWINTRAGLSYAKLKLGNWLLSG